jgi:mono/diheme cytochrome c family protein
MAALVMLVSLAGCGLGAAPSGNPVHDRCGACHLWKGVGARLAPPLDGVIERRGVEQVRRYIRDPRSVDPLTRMPPLKLSAAEIEAIVSELTKP